MTTARRVWGKGKDQRRGGALRPLAGSLAKIAGKSFGRRGLAEGGLIADWADVVGAEIAAICLPNGLTFHRSKERTKGTLTLRVANGHGLTLQHLEPMIVERINGYLGYPAVARLRLRLGHFVPRERRRRSTPPVLSPAMETSLSERVAGVEDADLRVALENLGRSILGESGDSTET